MSTTSGKAAKQSDGKPRTKAVIFDMGGVIIPSPMKFFFDFEHSLGLSHGTLLKAVSTTGPNGAWQRLERGEISAAEFGRQISDEYSSQTGKKTDLSSLLGRFVEVFINEAKPYPQMIEAIKCLRAEGIKTALLTNNFALHNTDTYMPFDKRIFDVIVESARSAMRKPEERIYKYTLEQLQVEPNDSVFLDDIGENVKMARQLGIRTIKVSDPDQAIADLEKEVNLPLRCFVEGTTSVPQRLIIPVDKLKAYMQSTLGLNSPDDPIVRCYEHGQSNPTYFVRYAGRNMVLRKKPPGKLLPSAHAVEREYRVMKAVQHHGVPVPDMLALCLDESVLGTPFYLMGHVEGRVFKDPSLPGLSSGERRDIYRAMCDVLVRIHSVNITKAGLEDYGRHGEFVKRNFARWAKQYEASKTEDIPAMNKLMQWLTDNMPTNEQCTIVHGDFRIDNLIFHPSRPEVLAVIDWELSTLGDPITDLGVNCLSYYLPKSSSIVSALDLSMLKELGIPTAEEYTAEYARLRGLATVPKWDFYVAFVLFRMAAILQGVYKRFTLGQASSPNAEAALLGTKLAAELGLQHVAEGSSVGYNKAPSSSESGGKRNYSTLASTGTMSHNYSTSSERNIPGSLPLSVSVLSPRAQDFHKKVKTFVTEDVIPLEKEFYKWSTDPKTKWTINPKLEALKVKACSMGLWNMFLPKESDPEGKYGAGLSNVEYAFLAEEMGRSVISSEAFNCSAPDTGNMEVLIRYGTEEQKEKWLKPLLEGKIRSCFCMTEPAVASSDATNIQSSIVRQGDSYIINGHKWWSSGAMDPRCKVAIFMGKTNPSAAKHQQQSMIIVPMDSPGIKIVRPLHVFGFDDAPHGHAEVIFDNVRVPLSNMLLGEGRGFEIAQGRLGPGRIHHCMRLIGSAERSLQLMADRVQKREAFGKLLIQNSSIQHDIAKSRIGIEQCRLLVLKAAHLMDTVGNKQAAAEIAMIKVAVPTITTQIIDRAIQAHGGMGVCQDTTLAVFYMHARMLRIADGPDEVHMSALAKMELRTQNLAKL